MSAITGGLPFVSCIVSLVFAFFVFRRYRVRRGTHLLLWGTGMVLYAIGGFCEAYYAALGWNALVFRLWYLCGAILVAAWLGYAWFVRLRRSFADVL